MLLETPGIATRSKKLLETPGIATRSKKLLETPGIATRSRMLLGAPQRAWMPRVKFWQCATRPLVKFHNLATSNPVPNHFAGLKSYLLFRARSDTRTEPTPTKLCNEFLYLLHASFFGTS